MRRDRETLHKTIEVEELLCGNEISEDSYIEQLINLNAIEYKEFKNPQVYTKNL